MRSNLLSFGVLFLHRNFSNLRYIITLYEYVGTTVVVFSIFQARAHPRAQPRAKPRASPPAIATAGAGLTQQNLSTLYSVYSLLPQSKEGREKTSKPVCGGGLEGERLGQKSFFTQKVPFIRSASPFEHFFLTRSFLR